MASSHIPFLKDAPKSQSVLLKNYTPTDLKALLLPEAFVQVVQKTRSSECDAGVAIESAKASLGGISAELAGLFGVKGGFKNTQIAELKEVLHKYDVTYVVNPYTEAMLMPLGGTETQCVFTFALLGLTFYEVRHDAGVHRGSKIRMCPTSIGSDPILKRSARPFHEWVDSELPKFLEAKCT